MSIDVLAREAGISKGLLYHYFPTKRAFYVATVRVAANRLLACTETSAELPPLERLQRALGAYLEYVRAHGPAYAALLGGGGVGLDRELGRIVQRTRARFVERITAGIARARAAEENALPVAAEPMPGQRRPSRLRKDASVGKAKKRGATSPPAAPLPPRLTIALRGFIGMAEAASLAWLDALTRTPSTAPTLVEMRDLLANAFVLLLGELLAGGPLPTPER